MPRLTLPIVTHIGRGIPVLYNDCCSGDFTTDANAVIVPTLREVRLGISNWHGWSHVPSHSKANSAVDVARCEVGQSSRNRKPSRHLPQALHLVDSRMSINTMSGCSARVPTTPHTPAPVMANPSSMFSGPPAARARPMPRKSPVPIAPPIPISWM